MSGGVSQMMCGSDMISTKLKQQLQLALSPAGVTKSSRLEAGLTFL